MGSYTKLEYDMDRYDYRISTSGNYVQPGSTYTNYSSTRAGMFSGAYKSMRDNEMYRLNGGIEAKLGKNEFVLKGGYGHAKSVFHSNTFCGTYSRTLAGESVGSREIPLKISVDRSGGNERPLFNLYSGPEDFSLYYPTNMSYYTGEWFDQNTTVKDKVGQMTADWQHNKPAFLPFTEFLKAGVAMRIKDYWRDFDNKRYNIVDPTADKATLGLLNDFTADHGGYGLFKGYYGSFPIFDIDKVNDFYGVNRDTGYFKPNTSASYRDRIPSTLKEEVYSTYLMGEFGYKKFWVMAGVRLERSKLTGHGDPMDNYEVLIEDGYLPNMDPGKVDQEFTDVFPSIHARYHLTRNIVLRASWSQSMGRPSVNKLTPGWDSVSDDLEDRDEESLGESTGFLEVNNTNLRPMYSDNFDLSAEYYFSRVGVVSVGLFAKNMSGYLYRTKYYIPNRTDADRDRYGDNAGKSIRTWWNMDETAKIRGIEMNYSQVLSFLPWHFKDTRLMLNCCYQSTSGRFGDSNATSDLVGFKPFVANAGLMFKFGRLEAHVFCTYNKEYLAQLYYNNNINETYHMDYDITVDVNLKYQFKRYLTIFVDVNNIFDHSPNTYILNDKNLVRSYNREGTRLSVGISGRF